MLQATTLLSAGIGPVLEKDVPYEGKNAELYDKYYSSYSIRIDSSGFVDYSSMTPLLTEVSMSEEQFGQFVAQYEENGYIYLPMETVQGMLAKENPEYADKTVFFSMVHSGNGDWTVDEKYRFHSEYECWKQIFLPIPHRRMKTARTSMTPTPQK